MNPSDIPLVRAEGITKTFHAAGSAFRTSRRVVHAVDGVSLEILRGETLGLVGESGSGKTTLGLVVLRLQSMDAGEIWFDGHRLSTLSRREMIPFRRRMQLIFQDPFGSLNPRLTIGSMLREILSVHSIVETHRIDERTEELLQMVGLDASALQRYPHEFSGGQRQRIGIARALAVEPEFIVCDEPVSSLDVSIQAQIINLLGDLQKKLGLTFLFIAHDLTVVEHVSDRVAVMYHGSIVESAPRDLLFASPKHPYTQALLDAIPVPDPRAPVRRYSVHTDQREDQTDHGCAFQSRCPHVFDACRTMKPALAECSAAHEVRCLLFTTSHRSGLDTE